MSQVLNQNQKGKQISEVARILNDSGKFIS